MLRALILWLLLPTAAMAQTLPQPLGKTVSDYANILDSATELRLTEAITEAQAKYGVQIKVATMERIADYGGAGKRLESYGKDLFNLWRIGSADRNDGILVLLVTEDRAVRIALGRGFTAVYDGYAQRVIDSAMLPLIRQDKWPQAAEAGVAGVVERIAVPFAQYNPPADHSSSRSDWLPYIWGAILAAGIGLATFGPRLKLALTPCPSCGQRGLKQQRLVVSPASTSASGQGIKTIRCPQCSYRKETPFVIAMLSRSSVSDRGSSGHISSSGHSSGDSGSGGGSSDGGGASGHS
jgi:uncharacterized protein